MSTLWGHGVEITYRQFVESYKKGEFIKLGSTINYPAGLRKIYELAELALERSKGHCPTDMRAHVNKDIEALCALAAAQKEMCARARFLQGSIAGLKFLNLSENELEDDDPEEIGELNREERVRAVGLAVNILGHFVALEEKIYPRTPASLQKVS